MRIFPRPVYRKRGEVIAALFGSKSFYRWLSLIPNQCHGLIQRFPLRYIQLLTHSDRPVSVPNYSPRIKSYIQILTLVKARKIPIQSIHDPCAPGIHPCGIGCPRLVYTAGLGVNSREPVEEDYLEQLHLSLSPSLSPSLSLSLSLSLSALSSSWLVWSLLRVMLSQCALIFL